MKKLTLAGKTHPGTHELAEGLVSMGRNPTNDIRVSDPTISSFHCELIISQASVVVRDLNSTNGTFIQDEPIQEAVLKADQILRLGQAEFILESAEVDEEPVDISIPQVSVESGPTQTHLLDGSLACLNHPGVGAVAKCTGCENAFCGECLHPLRVAGGATRVFCPLCSAPCELLPSKESSKKKPSFLGRLTQTIRIHLHKSGD